MVNILLAQQKNSEMEAIAPDWISQIRAATPPQPEALMLALLWLGGCRIAQDKWGEAQAPLRECLQICQGLHEQTRPAESTRCMAARRMLGEVLLRLNKPNEAEPYLLASYEGLRGKTGKWELIDFERTALLLAQLCETTGRPDEAAQWKARLAEFKKAYPGN